MDERLAERKIRFLAATTGFMLLFTAAFTRVREPDLVGYGARQMVVMCALVWALSSLFDRPWNPKRHFLISLTALVVFEALWLVGASIGSLWG